MLALSVMRKVKVLCFQEMSSMMAHGSRLAQGPGPSMGEMIRYVPGARLLEFKHKALFHQMSRFMLDRGIDRNRLSTMKEREN